jgi:hypothetical protein
MSTAAGRGPDRVRLAELVAALSLGLDLGFGQPMEHGLLQCMIHDPHEILIVKTMQQP